MVLAAGLGTRMRPITETMPKPLVNVAGTPLIDYGLAALKAAGVERAVVNVHYRADQMHRHLSGVSDLAITISDETEGLLDSGGGIVKALPLLGDGPFFILNADTFWVEDPGAPQGNLEALAAAFDPARMDFLLMVAAMDQATGHEGRGDFTLLPDGQLVRHDGVAPNPVIYAGAIVCTARPFEGAPDGPFSLNRLFDKAIAAGRLYGFRMRGHWLTVGTPDAIACAEAVIAGLAETRKVG
ncbi:MAG: nucleotidyltransferase family protein [Pararhizobium sp.]